MIWLLVTLCLVISFIFNGIEAGILSVNRVRLAHRSRQRDRAALKLERLLAHPDRLLITVLMVTNLANAFAVAVIAISLMNTFGRKAGSLAALAIYLPTYLLFVELLPKSLFRRFPYRALAALAEPLRLADMALTPLHFIGSLMQRLLFGTRPVMQQRLFLGREDFTFLANEGEKSGALSKDESKMIHNIVDFRAVTARDVMTPLDASRTLRPEAPVTELLEKNAHQQHDRWLIAGDGGGVTGVVSTFEVLLEGRRDVHVGVYQRRIVAVSPVEPAYNVLRKLRAARTTIAIVRGPGAAPLGVLTWGDLIRKLVSAVGDAKESRRDPKKVSR